MNWCNKEILNQVKSKTWNNILTDQREGVPAHLQVLQVALLRVAQQRGDPVVLPHAAAVAVLPQGENLPDHRHAPQCTVGKLQDLRVADFLHKKKSNKTIHLNLKFN